LNPQDRKKDQQKKGGVCQSTKEGTRNDPLEKKLGAEKGRAKGSVI